jgi:hypothetical protein
VAPQASQDRLRFEKSCSIRGGFAGENPSYSQQINLKDDRDYDGRAGAVPTLRLTLMLGSLSDQ